MSDNTEVQAGELKAYVDAEGKAHFVFEGVVESSIPLLTNSQNFAEAINELFQSGTEGVYNGLLRAVIDDKSGLIKIVIGETTENEEEEQHTEQLYNYTYVDFTEEIVTESTVGETTTTTIQSFSKRVVTEISDSYGNVIMRTDYDAETGDVFGYYDKTGKQIYLAEWRVLSE